jgi:hypothetical protein
MIVVTAGFKESLRTGTGTDYSTCTGVCALAVDKMWRILVGKSFDSTPFLYQLLNYSHEQVLVLSRHALLSTTVLPFPRHLDIPSMWHVTLSELARTCRLT